MEQIRTEGAIGNTTPLAEDIAERVNMELLSLIEGSCALPPSDVVGFLQTNITHPTGNGKLASRTSSNRDLSLTFALHLTWILHGRLRMSSVIAGTNERHNDIGANRTRQDREASSRPSVFGSTRRKVAVSDDPFLFKILSSRAMEASSAFTSINTGRL